MTAAVKQFKVVALGTTRDECIAALDKMGLALLNEAGGAPWLMIDDDIKRVLAVEIAAPMMGDEYGMTYVGERSYAFAGPLVAVDGQVYHDGNKVQSHGD